ncbi:thiopeptide-type bacteriocin biosynthesis domain-containing protein [Aquimarina amphilecti]|uniref:Thiopeptide-type bacteriocin biosynthesis domain-containing protein n=1 Tax=Aquimarina amphilecti TaxID=1038014 RepID=A0A1H7J448_AQUAM|nr:thiopeptide-type bacteriocin biosynthesis protein [Aquimarina amphilecti]SEK69521.1 thiopeptide-type bacteriocin biosynthesis domain-containing protein [Aquimarina amphilecti]
MGDVQRSFIIGSEWLYYKIYTGPKTSDLILTDIIKPIATHLLEKGIIDKWFFIRYNDPKHHIRVRFHYNKPENIAEVINSLYSLLKEYSDEDLVWKIQLDTYQREVERYGVKTMDLSEKLFFLDSKMIVDFLDMIDGDEGEELRWLFGVRAIDQLLQDFGYTEDDKLILLERLKIGFGSEFGMNKGLKKQMDKKFRNEHDKIKNFLSFERDTDPDYAPIIDVLEEKSKNSKSLVKEIQSVVDKTVLDDMMSSYIHMLMNRLFRSKNRLHEMVLYDLLYRTYKVAWGIRKFKNKT